FHAVLSLGFVAIVPYTYFHHLLTTPLNIFCSKLGPRGEIAKIENIEEAESLGVSKLEEFSWKRRLDFDACVECGRCQAACPAYLSGTALSPKQIIVKLKRHMHGDLPGPIHGELIKADELWACTTCMACVQECPAFIDIVDTIVDLRRYLALSEGALPSTAPQSLQNIQRAGNPWGLPAGERLTWAEGLDVPVMEPGKEVEYLYWVGCYGSFDERNKKVARALVRVLQAAGVDFAILGNEEKCTGEPARRLGHEYLYQTLAQGNIETLKRYRFQTIVTACPHCFNTIRNEFPQFGGNFQVIHHTQLLKELMDGGRIRATKALREAVTYHDPCYLSRYNGIIDEPRQVLLKLNVVNIEMEKHGDRGFCCGAGGARMW
ncbi:MAG: (Fe-S)-binding protein, partial [Burkholderiales bacterium]